MCEVSGYYLSNNKSSQSTLKKYHRQLKTIIPTWLELKENGNIVNKGTEADRDFVTSLINNEKIIPLVQNYQLKSSVSNQTLKNRHIWIDIINNLSDYLIKNSYQGANIDLEGIKKENKERFIEFMEEISRNFRQKDLNVDISVPAKIDDNSSDWAGGYDYYSLGQIAKRVFIMAYDYHWVNGPPGPIAPLPWVQDVIDYTIMKIDLTKIYLGIPLYGYDWPISHEERSARGLSFAQIMVLKDKFEAAIEWDQESQTPYLLYENSEGQHEVWFENRESLLCKLKLVKKYQLGGAVFWRLGLEDPAIWSGIMEIDKFPDKFRGK